MAQKTTARLPTIGAVIRAWRISHGFSETELADKAGVRLGYVSEIENDKKTRPQEEYLEKLADALGVQLEDILGRRMPPKDAASATTPSSKQGVAGQGSQQISADEDGNREAHAEENRAISLALPTIANPSLALTDSLLLTTFEQIEALIKSTPLSKEATKRVAAGLLDATKLLLKQHE